MEARVAQLESIVFGPRKAVNAETDLQTRVQQLEIALSTIENARPVIAELLKRVSVIDSITHPTPVAGQALKEQVVIASEPELRSAAKQLATIEELEKFSNTDAISSLPPLLPVVKRLQLAETNLGSQTDAHSAELLRLLSAYNNAILLISQKFIQLNNDLAQLEKDS